MPEFIVLEKETEEVEASEAEKYQLFEAGHCTYRVMVTNLEDPVDLAVWFYNQRAGAENLIKEANNDAGLAAHPSGRFDVNCIHFLDQMRSGMQTLSGDKASRASAPVVNMVAYNLNCWLMLFNREPDVTVETMRHTTLQTARLRFLFVAAKIWRHAGRTGISYSDHYEERGILQRLMERLRAVTTAVPHSAPVIATALI
jgi:hypothetical protein